MGIFSFFSPKKKTLRDIKKEDLMRERVSLEGEQRKIEREMENIIKDEKQLKSEYAAASSDMQKKSVARRIQTLRSRAGSLDMRMATCGKMLASVQGFLSIKENEEFFSRVGVGSIMNNMDVAEIESYVAECTVNGTLQQEKLAAVMQSLEQGMQSMSEMGADNSLEDIMAELDTECATAVHTTETVDPALLNELDALAEKGAAAAREAGKRVPAAKPEVKTESRIPE